MRSFLRIVSVLVNCLWKICILFFTGIKKTNLALEKNTHRHWCQLCNFYLNPHLRVYNTGVF